MAPRSVAPAAAARCVVVAVAAGWAPAVRSLLPQMPTCLSSACRFPRPRRPAAREAPPSGAVVLRQAEGAAAWEGRGVTATAAAAAAVVAGSFRPNRVATVTVRQAAAAAAEELEARAATAELADKPAARVVVAAAVAQAALEVKPAPSAVVAAGARTPAPAGRAVSAVAAAAPVPPPQELEGSVLAPGSTVQVAAEVVAAPLSAARYSSNRAARSRSRMVLRRRPRLLPVAPVGRAQDRDRRSEIGLVSTG
jgi:hypothetical protein